MRAPVKTATNPAYTAARAAAESAAQAHREAMKAAGVDWKAFHSDAAKALPTYAAWQEAEAHRIAVMDGKA